jgi:DsbC/DsbD-like thiol-disulfide interchange protein
MVIESSAMKKLSACLLAILTAVMGASHAAQAADHAQATLLADVSSIKPGTPFMLGIKINIDAGYHIYWKNPGDSGIATDVKLAMPEGFKAGGLQFPLPSRLEFPGPIVNYAYTKSVMLMVLVTPPKDVKTGSSITISAAASWLVCDENNCIPGSGNLSVDLPVSETASPANAADFKEWASQLPVPEDPADVASLSHSLSLSNGNGEASVSIAWKKAPSDLQYFPGPLQTGDVSNVKLNNTGDATRLTFDLKSFKADEPVTGLLTFTSATGAKVGLEISIPTGAGKK